MIKVGIPRALLYYQYYPMWKTFFEELGAKRGESVHIGNNLRRGYGSLSGH